MDHVRTYSIHTDSSFLQRIYRVCAHCPSSKEMFRLTFRLIFMVSPSWLAMWILGNTWNCHCCHHSFIHFVIIGKRIMMKSRYTFCKYLQTSSFIFDHHIYQSKHFLHLYFLQTQLALCHRINPIILSLNYPIHQLSHYLIN